MNLIKTHTLIFIISLLSIISLYAKPSNVTDEALRIFSNNSRLIEHRRDFNNL